MIESRAALVRAIADRSAVVGVIGLGYVGLPLATTIAHAGFRILGFDIDPAKVQLVNDGRSYIQAVTDASLTHLVKEGRILATSQFDQLHSCDVIIICVPTPLTRHRTPDLSFIESTVRSIAQNMRSGQLIILESTTFPGTTDEFVKPILQSSGLIAGTDFFLGFSPEREDPGSSKYRTSTIPKIVAGDGPAASQLVEAFYRAVVDIVVPVSSVSVAEAVKITENVFRAVNVALVNELKLIYDAMGIDVWEVIDAAATKPFGYMPFYPGPGLGGHCIPIDPFYLSWKSREYEISARFIELAGEINLFMPRYVLGKVELALDQCGSISLGAARILIVGIAYKKNVADVRESPSFKLMELLQSRGTKFDYHDPYVPEIPVTRAHPEFSGLKSVDLDDELADKYDAVVVVTDHDSIDYAHLARHAKLLIDTRNIFARLGLSANNIFKA